MLACSFKLPRHRAPHFPQGLVCAHTPPQLHAPPTPCLRSEAPARLPLFAAAAAAGLRPGLTSALRHRRMLCTVVSASPAAHARTINACNACSLPPQAPGLSAHYCRTQERVFECIAAHCTKPASSWSAAGSWTLPTRSFMVWSSWSNVCMHAPPHACTHHRHACSVPPQVPGLCPPGPSQPPAVPGHQLHDAPAVRGGSLGTCVRVCM